MNTLPSQTMLNGSSLSECMRSRGKLARNVIRITKNGMTEHDAIEKMLRMNSIHFSGFDRVIANTIEEIKLGIYRKQ